MRVLVLIAALLLFADATEASELLGNWQPLAGASVALGPFVGNAYYTVEPGDFYRLIVTVSGGADAPPIRFIAMLAAGQSASISTPRDIGEPACELDFVRRGTLLYVRYVREQGEVGPCWNLGRTEQLLALGHKSPT